MADQSQPLVRDADSAPATAVTRKVSLPRPPSLPVAYFRALLAIARKDLTAEVRSRELISAMLVFSLLVVLVFNFALELDKQARENVSAGVLWATFMFAGTLGLSRAFAAEKDGGSMDGLLLAPVDRTAIYFGKLISTLVIMLLVEVVVIPVFSLLYNISLFQPMLLVTVLLGTLGYAGVGTLLASMAVHSRTRDLILPILQFPVTVPVVIAAVKASTGLLAAAEWSEISLWLNILIVYDIIFLAVAFMLFEYVVEE